MLKPFCKAKPGRIPGRYWYSKLPGSPAELVLEMFKLLKSGRGEGANDTSGWWAPTELRHTSLCNTITYHSNVRSRF